MRAQLAQMHAERRLSRPHTTAALTIRLLRRLGLNLLNNGPLLVAGRLPLPSGLLLLPPASGSVAVPTGRRGIVGGRADGRDGDGRGDEHGTPVLRDEGLDALNDGWGWTRVGRHGRGR